MHSHDGRINQAVANSHLPKADQDRCRVGKDIPHDITSHTKIATGQNLYAME
jgi:hypothetical protein